MYCWIQQLEHHRLCSVSLLVYAGSELTLTRWEPTWDLPSFSFHVSQVLLHMETVHPDGWKASVSLNVQWVTVIQLSSVPTVVGAVGELASIKRRKLWKTGEDGLCCSSSAVQTRLGPSSLLEERSKTPIVFVAFFVLSATPQTGGNSQGI